MYSSHALCQDALSCQFLMSLRSSTCPQLDFLTCPMVLLVWHNQAVGSSCLGEFHPKDWQKYFLFHQRTYLKYWWIYKPASLHGKAVRILSWGATESSTDENPADKFHLSLKRKYTEFFRKVISPFAKIRSQKKKYQSKRTL